MTGAVIELILYEIFSLLMIWSHLATMCRDPGFIPFSYRYNKELLSKPFQVVQDQDMTGKELAQFGRLGVVDIEKREDGSTVEKSEDDRFRNTYNHKFDNSLKGSTL